VNHSPQSQGTGDVDDLLWESLDEARIREIETKWASESEDRIDAFERGELPAVDGPAALEELRSSLG
jgi:Putative addiction module component